MRNLHYTTKADHRTQTEIAMQNFLAAGGTINRVPAGAKTLTQAEIRAAIRGETRDPFNDIPDEEAATGVQIYHDSDGVEHARSLRTGNDLY